MDIEEADNRHVYGKESAKVCLKNLRKKSFVYRLNHIKKFNDKNQN